MVSEDLVWGCSSAGRVPDWQSGGREFDPRQLHHNSFITNHIQAARFNLLEVVAFGCVWVAFFSYYALSETLVTHKFSAGLPATVIAAILSKGPAEVS